MRDKIKIAIHEDDPLIIEVMSVADAAIFNPVEQDMTGRIASREIVINNITIRIYEP